MFSSKGIPMAFLNIAICQINECSTSNPESYSIVSHDTETKLYIYK